MILKNAKIVLEDKIISGWMKIENNKITRIQQGETKNKGFNLKGKIIVPGFIDCHTHGGYRHCLEDLTNESLNDFAKKVTAEGVTKYCQAIVTQPLDIIDKIMDFYGKWMKEENYKGIKARQIGMHMEGPFISKTKKGAHKLDLLISPSIPLVKKWIAKSENNIKIITYAIEKDSSGEFTLFLIKNNILPSIGHSNCTSEEFQNIAYKKGVRHITHLYNGMSELEHYTKNNGSVAGLANAALYNDDVLCELISDGIHVNDPTLKLTYKIKGNKGITLITDSLNSKGLRNGEYKSGTLDVVKNGMEIKVKGTNMIAGSAATYDHCYRYFKKTVNASYLAMAKMTSENIAKQLGIFKETGSIAVNKLADLTVLNSKDEVVLTIVEGKIAFSKIIGIKLDKN